MEHTLSSVVDHLHGSWSSAGAPILTVDPGDSIVASTRAGWGVEAPTEFAQLPRVIKRAERKDPEHDVGCCLLGPIAVRGAEAGMTLEVEIQELVVGSYGLCVTGGNPFGAYDRKGVDDKFGWMPWRYDREHGVARNLQNQAVSLRPFLGTLGVAPAEPGHHSNLPPRRVGGNIDCKELVAGSTLFLPIEVPGALFSFGDGHAAQGDGEIGDSAIESEFERVKLALRLKTDMPLRYPFAHTPSGWIAFGFHEDLKEAMYIALNGMLDFMVSTLSVSRKEALLLASLTVDLRITQAVNPVSGVHAFWPLDAASRLVPEKHG